MLQGRRLRADIRDVEQALIVRRWRRYGADRLYVTADTGAPLGSVDLATGRVALQPGAAGAADAPGVEAAVRRAVQEYLRADLPELVVPAETAAEAGPEPEARRPHGRRARPAAPAEDPPAAPAGSAAAPAESERRGRHRADDLVHPYADGEPRAAEETLCERLDRLVLIGWHVLHDVPVGRQGSVVAHLLVGPPGAFAVAERPTAPDGPEQFALDGRHLSADGHGVADLRDVRLAAARAGSLLRAAVGSPVGVRGALVVHGPVEVHDPSRCDALVLPESAVPEAFADLPARWTSGRVDAVAAVARRRSTWAVTGAA